MGLLAGLAALAMVALAVASRLGQPQEPISIAAMTLAAVAAGLAFGLSQSLVLRRIVPVAAWRFALHTGAAFGLAWLVGSAVAQHLVLGTLSRTLLFGTMLGVLVGDAQALVLWRHITDPWRWIVTSALAWTVGMAAIVAGFDLAQGFFLPIAGLVGGIVAVGSITAVGAVCLVPRGETPPGR
jgi:hypothetical protein